MDKLITILMIFGTLFAITIAFLITTHIFYKFIYLPYKQRAEVVSAADLLATLTMIMDLQINIYEKNVFKKKQTLDSAAFENYYKEISKEIFKCLSPDFLYRFSFYMTEEAVGTIVCRYVKQYLADKIINANKN